MDGGIRLPLKLESPSANSNFFFSGDYFSFFPLREIILLFLDVVFVSFSLCNVAKRQKPKSFLLFWMSFFVRNMTLKSI